MEKRIIKNIAISGLTGSGKSTLAKKLAEKLGWKVMSTGSFIRKWHEESGVPFLSPDKIPEAVDKQIDYGYQDLMKKESNMIFESRLAGWLSKEFPETFKVLVKCEESVAAQRISGRDGVDGERAMKEGALREGLLKDKFIRLYDAGDYLDEGNFDLVIDTAKVGADEAMQLVLDKVNQTSG
jgi:cytidylate kinase